MTAPAFDPRPLTDPVDPAAVRAHRRATGASVSAATVISFVVGGIAIAVVVFAILPVVFGVLAHALSGALGAGSLVVGVLPVIVIAGLVVLGIVGIARGIRNAGVRAYRLDRFARANAMTHIPRIPNPGLPGMIFSIGSSRVSLDAVRGEQPRFVEFSNYRYTTGSGKSQTTHVWGYVAIQLDTPLPHIVLDALSNNGLFGATNLPRAFDTDQRLSLEGDFDKYFTLYCPAGYERDALYLFTPDIMARFIDNAAALDVEIVDDWLFLYARRDLVTLDPAMWAWLFSVASALLEKLAQWGRWRDEHLATVAAASAPTPVAGAPALPVPVGAPRTPPGVAPAGRRLKGRVPWVAIVIGVVFVVGWFLVNSGVLGMLFR